MNTYQLASGHWRRPFSLLPSWPISGRCRSAGSTSMRADSSNCRLRYGVLLHLSCSVLRSWALCWIRTLVSNPSSNKTSWSTRMLTRIAAYLYLSQLETSNPKFQRKEDVLWYLITVGGFIIVGLTSLSFLFFSSPLDCTFSLKPVTTHWNPRNICPHSAMHTTIAVPGTEEDYRYISAAHHSQNTGWAAVWPWWECFG